MAADFHSHILPGIDDGSRSAEESVAMLRLSAEQGIREVVLTPHFYPQYMTPEQFLENRARAWECLHEQLQPGLPRLRRGAEVYYYPHMSHSEALRELAIEGTDCVLVEMPMGRWTDRMYRELAQIRENLGLTPIIAHVDRYLGRFLDHGIPQRLSELPVLIQANADFFLTGGRGMGMLRRQQIHLLGSDCHNMKTRRPNLGAALKNIRRKLGDEAIDWLNANEQEILG